MAIPTQKSLHALWVNGPRDAWALGAGGTALRWDGTLRWDGASWTELPVGGSPRGMLLLQGTRDGRLWLGGDALLRQQAP